MSEATATETILATDRTQFLLRRLHSLTGIIPVGAFLAEHLLTNSGAWYGGAARFNKDVKWIQDLPFLFVMEWGMIFLPLAFHMAYGAIIAWGSQANPRTYPYLSNTRYTLQRTTAWITLVFVVVHLLKFRFAYLLGGEVFAESRDWFVTTQQGLLHWHVGAFYVPAWFTLTFYVIGVTAAVYHFANGVWTFSIVWGILGGPRSQRWFSFVSLSIGVVMCLLGYLGLYGLVMNQAASADMPLGH